MSLLRVENLSVSHQKRMVVDDISFAVGEGEFVGLIGPNGAGKSTLLRAILAQLPYQGSVTLNGQESAQLKNIRRAQILSYIAQDREISWNMRVEAVVQLGRLARLSHFSGLSLQDQQLVEEAINALEIGHLRDKPARELSGGEQARVLIARALAQGTPLMLADEPVAGLDPSHQLSLMQIFRDLAESGRSIICTLHDLGLAARWCTRLLLVKDGGLVADGKPAEILHDEVIRDLYGVDVYRAETADGLIIQPVRAQFPKLKSV
ncbi:ABC transporter ATP-binding protein [Pseudochrobactrum asaccharolyticum]|uniref:Iron complex transport system ATP-binding protein n=1 Tax=Pseudochrobactrum asaccharolyticum TaxID=354351 RepID=A0A366E5J9_9HYPH|nr:ABC transporter ATP-binding protein [Pseudochrobactrum asaccharolyticum]RBO97597.1 iron complex transport system ATP-binding protein [Pseudochrobactrum asaccharolyticum]